MNENHKTDLIALSHPLVLASILILLINDHVLKVYAPSTLTGKISDFAGLFFFPILLSAILNLIFKPLNPQPRHIALVAFGFTTIWFTLIKTIPFFNNFTESVLSVQIIRDPSDLIALIMLLPAWNLRTNIEKQKEVKVQKLSYVILCFASFATIATSPPAMPLSIYNLVVYENIIYANAIYSGKEYFSLNGGKTWEEVDFEIPEQVIVEMRNSVKSPFTLCILEDQNLCYKTGDEVILESNDGGKTWIISWSIPEGRREFLSRNFSTTNFGPYHLVFITYEGQNVILASLGNGGVLVKTDSGPWEIYGVNGIGPLSFGAKNLNEAVNSLGFEGFIIFVVGIIYFSLNLVINKDSNQKVLTNLFLLLAVIAISYSMFILWAFGTIPFYETAKWVAIGLNICLFFWIVSPILKEDFKQNETFTK
jgi:hypothetical protein